MHSARLCVGGASALACVALACGCAADERALPVALWSDDPAHPDNPIPDERAGEAQLRDGFYADFVPRSARTLASDESFALWSRTITSEGGWGRSASVAVHLSSRPLCADTETMCAEGLAFVPLVHAPNRPPLVIAAEARWIDDPGYLLVRPALPLPEDARMALVVTTALARRSADFAAWAEDEGRGDIERAAAGLQIAHDDIALLAPYRTVAPRAGLVDAIAVARAEASRAALAFTTHGGRHAGGTFASVELRDRDGVFDLSRARPSTLGIVAALPDPTLHPPPWRALIAQHGFAGDKGFALDVANAFTNEGFAVFGIDASSHGERGSVFGFFRVDDPRVAREHLRQTLVDLVLLHDALAHTPVDVDGDGAADLDGTVSFYGHSMGAILGATLAAIDPGLDAVALNAFAGGFADIFTSERLLPAVAILLRPALGLAIDDPAYDDALPIAAAVLQTIMEPADPIAFTPAPSEAAPDRGPDAPPLLLQMNLGDRTLPNTASVRLARALGAREVSAPVVIPDAACPLWVLDPAAFGLAHDEDPHGMHARFPGIHTQAAVFLASSGAKLIIP